MKVKVITLFLCFIAFSTLSSAEEKVQRSNSEVSIMGITLGKSLSEVNIPECEYEKPYEEKMYNFKQSRVCWQKGLLIRKSIERTTTYLEINTLSALSFYTTTYAFFASEVSEEYFKKEPITEISISIDSSDGDKMYELLKDKFGEPASYEASITQNMMGAKFDKFTATWLIGGNAIYFTNRHTKVNEGFLRATSKAQEILEKEKKSKVKDKENF